MAKIHICDDDNTTLMLLTGVLRKNKHEAYAARSYSELRKNMEVEGDGELLLLDIYMPEHDGYWVLEEIRNEGNKIPIILMTAQDIEVFKMYSPFIGNVSGCICKPFDLKELIEKVNKAINDKNISLGEKKC